MFNKKNLPLILAFLTPILMVLFVAVSAYLPELFMKPKYSFVYSTNDGYYGSQVYKVNDGRLIEIPTPTPGFYNNQQPVSSVELYLHNTESNSSTPISFQTAASYTLDSSLESPDGYTVENASGYGMFPFSGFSGDYDGKYLVGNNMSKKLNLRKTSSSYSGSIQFLGWILN